MIDETLVSTVRDRLKKLLPYRRQVRPTIPASFPSFVDGELLRIDTATRDIVGGLKALDPILEALKGEQGGGGAPFPEAPLDGTPYARQDAGWTPVATIKGEPGEPGQPGEPGEPGRDGEDGKDGAEFPDAPLDGQLYARKGGDWAAFDPGSGGGSAPSPNLTILRMAQNGPGLVWNWNTPAWTAVDQNDLGAFSASTPERVTVPPGVTRMRCTANLVFSEGYSVRFVHLIRSSDGASYFHVLGPAGYSGLTGPTPLATEWLAVTPGEQFEFRVNPGANNLYLLGGARASHNDNSRSGAPSRAQFEWA